METKHVIQSMEWIVLNKVKLMAIFLPHKRTRTQTKQTKQEGMQNSFLWRSNSLLLLVSSAYVKSDPSNRPEFQTNSVLLCYSTYRRRRIGKFRRRGRSSSASEIVFALNNVPTAAIWRHTFRRFRSVNFPLINSLLHLSFHFVNPRNASTWSLEEPDQNWLFSDSYTRNTGNIRNKKTQKPGTLILP